MRKLATAALVVLTVIVSAIYLPILYEKLFFKRIEKTHLLFSSVTGRFIYKEKIVGPVPPEAVHKSEDHHAEIAYRDADGAYYTRVEFEKNLPFIYYKNMEMWGLLPLRLGGREFYKDAIKKNRQVLALMAGEINGHWPQTPLWPLLESNPGQVRLVFPEDRFRMTDHAMEFINADTNTVDNALTTSFTSALMEKGFVFPARSVNGKFTILKPFDEGVFLVDAEYSVFHVKRSGGRPVVVQTPIEQALQTRHIKISENKRHKYYGLLLAGDGSLHLLTYDNYRLITLPLAHYDPDRMDFKLIINPLYHTAVYSDENTIWGVAMDGNCRPIQSYRHRMSRANVTVAQQVYAALFPFRIHMGATNSAFLLLSVHSGGFPALIGILCSIGCYAAWLGFRKRRLPGTVETGLVALTGIYGIIAINMVGLKD